MQYSIVLALILFTVLCSTIYILYTETYSAIYNFSSSNCSVMYF